MAPADRNVAVIPMLTTSPPPIKDPMGITLQKIVRMVAFIRPLQFDWRYCLSKRKLIDVVDWPRQGLTKPRRAQHELRQPIGRQRKCHKAQGQQKSADRNTGPEPQTSAEEGADEGAKQQTDAAQSENEAQLLGVQMKRLICKDDQHRFNHGQCRIIAKRNQRESPQDWVAENKTYSVLGFCEERMLILVNRTTRR